MKKVDKEKSYMIILFYPNYHKRIYVQCVYVLERLRYYHKDMRKAEIYKYNHVAGDYLYMCSITIEKGLI